MNFIDGESSVTRQRILLTIISILMTSGVVGFITAAVNRLTKHKIDDYKDKVRARYEKNN
jgi:archaellum component FlaG (FlaF/FlaG flagellin family)